MHPYKRPIATKRLLVYFASRVLVLGGSVFFHVWAFTSLSKADEKTLALSYLSLTHLTIQTVPRSTSAASAPQSKPKSQSESARVAAKPYTKASADSEVSNKAKAATELLKTGRTKTSRTPENPRHPRELMTLPAKMPEPDDARKRMKHPEEPNAHAQASQSELQGLKASAEPLLVQHPAFVEPPNPPPYPELARKRGRQGTVLMEVWIDQYGRQTKLEVMRSSGTSSLDRAAVRAVRDWKFKPYEREGETVASRLQIPVEFALN